MGKAARTLKKIFCIYTLHYTWVYIASCFITSEIFLLVMGCALYASGEPVSLQNIFSPMYVVGVIGLVQAILPGFIGYMLGLYFYAMKVMYVSTWIMLGVLTGIITIVVVAIIGKSTLFIPFYMVGSIVGSCLMRKVLLTFDSQRDSAPCCR